MKAAPRYRSGDGGGGGWRTRPGPFPWRLAVRGPVSWGRPCPNAPGRPVRVAGPQSGGQGMGARRGRVRAQAPYPGWAGTAWAGVGGREPRPPTPAGRARRRRLFTRRRSAGGGGRRPGYVTNESEAARPWLSKGPGLSDRRHRRARRLEQGDLLGLDRAVTCSARLPRPPDSRASPWKPAREASWDWLSRGIGPRAPRGPGACALLSGA